MMLLPMVNDEAPRKRFANVALRPEETGAWPSDRLVELARILTIEDVKVIGSKGRT